MDASWAELAQMETADEIVDEDFVLETEEGQSLLEQWREEAGRPEQQEADQVKHQRIDENWWREVAAEPGEPVQRERKRGRPHRAEAYVDEFRADLESQVEVAGQSRHCKMNAGKAEWELARIVTNVKKERRELAVIIERAGSASFRVQESKTRGYAVSKWSELIPSVINKKGNMTPCNGILQGRVQM